MVSLMDASLYTAALSAALLLGLILTYAKVYRDTRAQFSLGLTIFAAILFAQNILAVYSFVTMSPFIGEPFLPYLLGINIAQVLGILVLFRTTLRDRKSTRLNSSHRCISYAVFCLKKKKKQIN